MTRSLLLAGLALFILNGCREDNGSPSQGGDRSAPGAVGLPAVTVGDAQLTVAWAAVDHATSYRVLYNTVDDAAGATACEEVTALSYVIAGLQNGTEYFVWLEAINQNGTSRSEGRPYTPTAGGGGIDTVPPVTWESVSSGWYVGPLDVSLDCVDDDSGCAATYYTLDGSEPTTSSLVYTGDPIHLTQATELRFFSVDAAGNQELPEDVRLDVLPAGSAPHLRIARGEYEAWSFATELVSAGVLTLTGRSYGDQAFWMGDAANASAVGGVEDAVTAGGQPLHYFDDAYSFFWGDPQRPAGLDTGVTRGDDVRLYVRPTPGHALPLHLATPGAAPGMPDPAVTLGPGTLDIPDMPVLHAYLSTFSRESRQGSLTFTGPLYGGSAGRFDRVVISGYGDGGAVCQVTIAPDDPALAYTQDAHGNVWNNVVTLTLGGDVAQCFATPYDVARGVVDVQFQWDAPAAEWFEAVPFEPQGPKWLVTLEFTLV